MDLLAHNWPWGLHKYAIPPVSLLAETQTNLMLLVTAFLGEFP